MAVALGVFTSSQTFASTTVSTTAKALPAVDLSATPAGWVPVAFGDAQVSVPPTWWVLYNSSVCVTGSPVGGVYVNPSGGFCSARGTPKGKTAVALMPLSENEYQPPSAYGQRQVINGITVYELYSFALTTSGGTYLVPSFGVEIEAEGPLANRVMHTLTRSPRAVVLASGPVPAAQYGWHTLTFERLSFTAPAWWQVTRTSYNYGIGTPCASLPGVSFFNEGVGGGEVVLSTDRFLAAFPCPIESGTPGPVYPGGGIEVDAGSNTLSELATEGLHPAFSRHCPDLHGLTACPASSPAYSILVLKVRVPGRATPVFVSIGLAGNGMVARTILYSLRRA
jgi:hypothetical protein